MYTSPSFEVRILASPEKKDSLTRSSGKKEKKVAEEGITVVTPPASTNPALKYISFYVPKALLESASDGMKAHLNNPMLESSSNCMTLHDADGPTFARFLSWLYTQDRESFDDDTILLSWIQRLGVQVKLLFFSDRLMITDLGDTVGNFIKELLESFPDDEKTSYESTGFNESSTMSVSEGSVSASQPSEEEDVEMEEEEHEHGQEEIQEQEGVQEEENNQEIEDNHEEENDHEEEIHHEEEQHGTQKDKNEGAKETNNCAELIFNNKKNVSDFVKILAELFEHTSDSVFEEEPSGDEDPSYISSTRIESVTRLIIHFCARHYRVLKLHESFRELLVACPEFARSLLDVNDYLWEHDQNLLNRVVWRCSECHTRMPPGKESVRAVRDGYAFCVACSKVTRIE